MKLWLRAFESAGWDWDGPWELEMAGYVDKDGWTYGVDFGTVEYPPAPGCQRKALQHFVRRRRWVRRRRETPRRDRSNAQQSSERGDTEDADDSSRMMLGVVEPGDSLPLPFGWRTSGNTSLLSSCCNCRNESALSMRA